MSGRWRRVLAAGVVTALAVFAVLATDVGLDHGTHATAPDPCDLISEETIADVLGQETAAERSEPFGPATWRLLSRGEQRVRCLWAVDPDAILEGQLRLDVTRYHGAQFRLGRSGAAKAAADHDIVEERLCSYPVDGDDARACVRSDQPLDLAIVHENVRVGVYFVPAVSGPRQWSPEELASRFATEVATHLIVSSGGG